MACKHRLWESFKTLLIVLLSLSALFLLSMSPLVTGSGLAELLSGRLSGSPDSAASVPGLTAAAIPVRLAVGSEKGLYGVQYDQAAAAALYDLTAPLLGEALSAAEPPALLSERQWQKLFSGAYVWFDFTSPVPLSTLRTWLGGEGGSGLTGSARYILLAQEDDDTLSLCYQGEDGAFYLCKTGLAAALHLSPVLNGVTPNGAFFAFESDALPSVISPYTLFTGGELSPAVYTAAPLLLSDSSQIARLLSALSFSDQNRANVSEGILFVDGEDTLRLTGDGQVVYASSGSGKYPAGEGLDRAVEAVWPLAERALGTLSGDARPYLISAQQDGTGYTVTFGYMLNGSVVQLHDRGWCARFRVEQGSIREFILYPRTYTPSGQTSLLLPAERAAAALTALTGEPRELVIQYRDNGGETVEPGWKAR